MDGIIRKIRLCYKSLEAEYPLEMSAAPRSRIHICKKATRRLKSIRDSCTQDVRIMLLRNCGLCHTLVQWRCHCFHHVNSTFLC